MVGWRIFSKKADANTAYRTGMSVPGLGSSVIMGRTPTSLEGLDSHRSVMRAAPSGRERPRAEIRARKAPARGWYSNLGNPALDEALDAGKRSAKTKFDRAVATIAAGPSSSISETKPIEIPHFTLRDAERKYQDRFYVSDPYYHNILVGGANAGGEGILGASHLPFGILSKGPNRELFRNGEIEKIKGAINASLERGEHPRVVGHSWGGADVANLSKEYPDIPFIALDPVSWTNTMDEYPDNLTVMFPNEGTSKSDNLASILAPIFGHRWARPKKGRVVTYDGGHTDGIDEAITALNYMEWAKRDPMGFLGYYDEEGNRRPEPPQIGTSVAVRK